MRVRIELHEWNLSSLELGEEWPEPVGVLVENCNWLVVPCGHVSISVEVRKTKKPRSGGSRGRIGVEGVVPAGRRLAHRIPARLLDPDDTCAESQQLGGRERARQVAGQVDDEQAFQRELLHDFGS